MKLEVKNMYVCVVGSGAIAMRSCVMQTTATFGSICAIVFRILTPTSDARNWLECIVGHEPETNFAIAVAGEAVGGIGFTLQPDVARRSAEIGYWLGEEFWGRGIATEALIAVTDYAFANHDLCRVYAHVFDWNRASARVLEKAGYEFEGRMRKSVTKDGQTIDQLMYAIVRE